MFPFSKSLDRKANEAMDSLDKRIDGLIESEQRAKRAYSETIIQVENANKEIAELRSKLRQQTEADLYLASAKIMRDIMEKGKASVADVEYQKRLQVSFAQQAAQGASSFSTANPYAYSMGNGLMNRVFG